MPADFKNARKVARELLATYKVIKPPVDPEALAEAEGINVVYADFNGVLRDQVAGYSDPMNGRIVVNRAMAPNRKTYTIAHELGHHKLHRDYLDNEGAYQVFLRRNSYDGPKPPEEQEADAFAAELLVPLNMLREYVDFASTYELARIFLVSEDVILNRKKWL